MRLGLAVRLDDRVERVGELVGREDVGEVDRVEAHAVAVVDLVAAERLDALVEQLALAPDQRVRAGLLAKSKRVGERRARRRSVGWPRKLAISLRRRHVKRPVMCSSGRSRPKRNS